MVLAMLSGMQQCVKARSRRGQLALTRASAPLLWTNLAVPEQAASAAPILCKGLRLCVPEARREGEPAYAVLQWGHFLVALDFTRRLSSCLSPLDQAVAYIAPVPGTCLPVLAKQEDAACTQRRMTPVR